MSAVITRKKSCPKCENKLRMDINPKDGYGRGIYICTCGYQAHKEAGDHIGSHEAGLIASKCDYCSNMTIHESGLCSSCIQAAAAEEASN